jgi:hypothetical protein
MGLFRHGREGYGQDNWKLIRLSPPLSGPLSLLWLLHGQEKPREVDPLGPARGG